MDVLKLSAVVMAAAAAVKDMKSGKIPNCWVLAGMLLAFCLRIVSGTGIGWKTGAGMLLPFVLLFPLFWFRMLGAGDIKLFCVLGILLEEKILWCIAWSFGFGAVLSMIRLFRDRELLKRRFQYLGHYVTALSKGEDPGPYRQGGTERPENLPFAPAVLMSVLLFTGGVY